MRTKRVLSKVYEAMPDAGSWERYRATVTSLLKFFQGRTEINPNTIKKAVSCVIVILSGNCRRKKPVLIMQLVTSINDIRRTWK